MSGVCQPPLVGLFVRFRFGTDNRYPVCPVLALVLGPAMFVTVVCNLEVLSCGTSYGQASWTRLWVDGVRIGEGTKKYIPGLRPLAIARRLGPLYISPARKSPTTI